jgi:hypothetical protein
LDPTGHDTTAELLAYAHPAVMFLALALAGLTLRAGLAMRRSRTLRSKRPPGLLQSHLRLAKPAVALLLAGFTFGPVSAIWFRDWTPFGTFHAWLGVLAALLFGSAALLGRRLEAGRVAGERGKAAQAHGLVGAVALLVGAVAAAAGFVLLP